jgi:uncharacterized protein
MTLTMKRPALLAVALAAALLAPAAAWALEVPTLEGRVNDHANLLSPAARQRLEQQLAAYEASSGHQFALLTLPSLDGDALEPFSIRVVESWKLGKKGTDDGLLLLVVNQPHAIRIEVGYGLEAAITDAQSARVIREVISPAFGAGDYAAGIERAFGTLMTAAGGGVAVSGGEKPPARAARAPSGSTHMAILLFALMFLGPFAAVLLLAGIYALLNRGGRFSRGGPLSGSGGAPAVGGDSSSGASSSSSGGDSSGGGGFSGGGGDFGGGGASGSW